MPEIKPLSGVSALEPRSTDVAVDGDVQDVNVPFDAACKCLQQIFEI